MEVYEGNEEYKCSSEGSEPGEDSDLDPDYEGNEERKCSSEGSEPGEDSDMDPDYCFLEETCEKLSGLSIKKKSKSRGSAAVNDQEEMEYNMKDFELVEKMIESGEVEKLKLEQCKVYLRKNRLRLTGNKNTLILRIKEHLQISNGGGEKKYPVSSFVWNCKGDACTGDVVMFEHNVYEMYNLASRSASGPPIGKRIVAGRIVKESYGTAKQQHTFTIEVLWSKGEKPLPPLHPLLIKGRNLYRLWTMRQRWEDEEERHKALMEKHTRGSHARSDRETRIHAKEMGKQLKANRVLTGGSKRNQYQLNVLSREKAEIWINGEFREVQHRRDEGERRKDLMEKHARGSHARSDREFHEVRHQRDEGERRKALMEKHTRGSHAKSDGEFRDVQHRRDEGERHKALIKHTSSSDARSDGEFRDVQHRRDEGERHKVLMEKHTSSSDARLDREFLEVQHHRDENFRANHRQPIGRYPYGVYRPASPSQRQGWMKQQMCPYHQQGRCYSGDNCRYLHEMRHERDRTWDQGHRKFENVGIRSP